MSYDEYDAWRDAAEEALFERFTEDLFPAVVKKLGLEPERGRSVELADQSF